ncbi:hypothetical protein O181_047925 [Austropuccinia psidii MF-1]|uniref:Uncharacterized protein n=1 Tax=Austropuccinia psidii MF-1 TaxID=1389203 RepID=A0A9Q3HNP2_9BASI|nr:hypothetical protein [Austropuccinia psidii MF-1]
MLKQFCNPRLPYDTLKNNLVDINPTASSFKIILDKARHWANRCMQDSFKYLKERWDKSNKPPDFKVGDLVLVQLQTLITSKAQRNLNIPLHDPL